MLLNQFNNDLIIKQRNKDLLKSHKNLISLYLKNVLKLNLKVRVKILAYYDTQINESNILNHYNKRFKIFLTDILT
jgi:hypothetical protein